MDTMWRILGLLWPILHFATTHPSMASLLILIMIYRQDFIPLVLEDLEAWREQIQVYCDLLLDLLDLLAFRIDQNGWLRPLLVAMRVL
jgi:hypothetical protein